MEFYQEPEESRVQILVSWIVDIIVVIALAIYLVYAVGSRVEVTGSSMHPVLKSGDEVLINRLAYDLGSLWDGTGLPTSDASSFPGWLLA